MYFHISDFWDHRALHDRPTFVILYIPDPALAIKGDLFGETLLLEVSDGVVVCISKEVVDRWARFPDIVFERVHEMRSISLEVSSAWVQCL